MAKKLNFQQNNRIFKHKQFNIRIPEAQNKKTQKDRSQTLPNAIRRAADHSSATQLTQCNNACNAKHAMRRDIGMKLHEYRAKNISFYNTSVLKFAMFCSFHNNCLKIFYFYRLCFDEFITEITKIFPCYRLRVA